MKKILIILFTLFSSLLVASNKYDVQFCYVTNGIYTPWEQTSCFAVGGKNDRGKIEMVFYMSEYSKVCFVFIIEDLDLYSMSKKEIRQRKKHHQPFIGRGEVRYYSRNGRYDIESFPIGDAYSGGQWMSSNATFKCYSYKDHDIFEISFKGQQLSVALF